jgi:general secretion pathway protein D
MKTILLVLLLAALSLQAQTPPQTVAEATNRIETLRRALRASAATNAPTGLPAPPGPVIQPNQTPAPAPATPQATGAVQPPATVPPAPGVPAAAVPTTPGAAPAAMTPAGAPAATPSEEDKLTPGLIDFQSADIGQVLTIYSKLVNRTILRPSTLPTASIILKTETDLTRTEAIQALDAVLALNGISMINVSDKFVKALPLNLANAAGAPISTNDPSQYPELGSYVTHIVQVKYLKPSEIAPTLQQFQSMATAVVAIDTSGLLVLRDNAENVKRMLEMVERVDIAVPSEFLSEVIPIKFAQAEDIASALNSLSSGGGGTTVGTRATTPTTTGGARTGQPGYGQPGQPTMPGQPTTGTPSSRNTFSDRLRNIIQRASASGSLEILGETKIIADVRSNSLLIFAARQDMAMIKDIINKLDVVLAQVLIETIIMDVSLDSSWALGVTAGKPPETRGNLTSGGVYNNSGQLDTLSQFFGGALTNAFPSSSGFSYFGRYNNDLDVVLQAVASDSKVNVIQKPRIQTSHATPASIFIGSTVPYVSGSFYGGGYAGGAGTSFQQLRVGIGLNVTPFINADGLVVMKIDETIDEISGSTAIVGVGDVPNTTSRTLSAEVAVHDRETIILGGFIRNSQTKTKSGVPILKDIPLLGYLFRSTGDSKERKELIVLMRPTVLRTPELAAAQVDVEKSRLPGVRQAERDIDELERKALEKEKRKSSKTPAYEETPRFLTPDTATPDTSTP